jgi:uncharacterized SAM-binding protein YcdF (DUF218 family)
MSKLLWWLFIIITVLTILFMMRFIIMRGLASFLIVDYKPAQADAIIVLSGNAYDRGKYAAQLVDAGVSRVVICTGGNKDPNALILGKDFFECELTKMSVEKFCSDTSVTIDTLCRGTSTLEECFFIKSLIEEKAWKHIVIVSSAFHTRRIRMTCEKVFKNTDVQIDIAPAKPHMYNTDLWWQNEYGLIDLNNEYVKLFYYLFK